MPGFEIPRCFFRNVEEKGRPLFRIRINHRNLRMAQSRRFGRPRRSRSQHSNPGGTRCLSSASVAQMLAAARVKVMDALFGFLARNDAEWTERELLGRSWRRDWGMRKFRPKNAFLGDPEHPIHKHFPGRQIFPDTEKSSKFAQASISRFWASQKVSFTASESWWRQLSF